MSIQYPAQGFELMTFWYESSSLTIRPGAGPIKILQHKFYATQFFQAFWMDPKYGELHLN